MKCCTSVTFYTDEAEWRAAVGLVETFEFNPDNLATANQVAMPPQMYPNPPTNLGGVLTFWKNNSGLVRSFELRTVQNGADFVYNDNQINPAFWNKLAVGKQNIHEDDDWELEMLKDGNPPLYGFAVDIIENDCVEAGEAFRVFDEDGNLLDSLPIENFALHTFFGVVSSNPIGFIFFEEATGDDDMCLDKVHFEVGGHPPDTALQLCDTGEVALNGTSPNDTDPVTSGGWTYGHASGSHYGKYITDAAYEGELGIQLQGHGTSIKSFDFDAPCGTASVYTRIVDSSYGLPHNWAVSRLFVYSNNYTVQIGPSGGGEWGFEWEIFNESGSSSGTIPGVDSYNMGSDYWWHYTIELTPDGNAIFTVFDGVTTSVPVTIPHGIQDNFTNFGVTVDIFSHGSEVATADYDNLCFIHIPGPTLPTVTTQPAINVGSATATLCGRVEDDGGEACEVRFRYKKEDSSYSYFPWVSSKTTGQSFYVGIGGLSPGSKYYYNAQARNSAGESDWGNERSFTTLSECEGTILLLAPNGWEELPAGCIYEIIWETTGPVENVLIEYSANNGTDWTVIDTVSNTGSYEWLVPLEDSNQCLVRISDADCPSVNDTSDDLFTIYQCTLAYDLNHDCFVDFFDFALLATEWLQCGNPLDPNCRP